MRRILLPMLTAALAVTPARAEMVEYIFVMRDALTVQRSNDELIQRQDQVDAECRFETNKAVASAGSVAIQGSPGIGMQSNSAIGGALSNLATALTTTPPAMLRGMTRAQAFDFFLSCFEARGYRVMTPAAFEAEKARVAAARPGTRLVGVIQTYVIGE